MKFFTNLMTATIILLALTQGAQAAWLQQSQISVNGVEARATAQNFGHRPIVCWGKARGMTAYAGPIFSRMDKIVLWPGQYAYVYVYTNWNNQFVNADSRIWCDYH